MGQPSAEEGEFPIFVFNYMPYEVRTVIETEFTLADQNWSEDVFFAPHVYTAAGEELSCQQIKENSTIAHDWRKRIVFTAKLNPLGITRFTVRVTEEKKKLQERNKFASFKEIRSVQSLLEDPVIPELYDDTSDPWGMSEEELKSLGKHPVVFRAMSGGESRAFCAVDQDLYPFREIERGPICRIFESLHTAGKSNMAVQYKVYKDIPFMDLKVTLEFMDKNKLVRLKTPVPAEFTDGKPVGDGPYVWEQKPKGETVFQKWFGLQNSDGRIFSVINDGIYAGKAEKGFLSLTLIRGAGYCMHPIPGRELYPQDRYLPRIDCGRYEYNLRLFVGNAAQVCREAELFNQRPYALNVFPAGGTFEAATKNIVLEGDVILSAAKPCEEGYMFRIYNPSDFEAAFQLKVGNAVMQDTAKAREIVTVIGGSEGLRSDHNDLHDSRRKKIV